MRDHLQSLAIQNYSAQTVRNRQVRIRLFIQWCQERGLADPVEVTRPVLERYQRHLFHYRKKNGEPLSFRSQHSCLVPLRMWFRWMTRQNHILHNPASELELPRLGQPLPKNILSAQEVERSLQLCDVADPIGLRDRAMLEVLYSTGMRRMEMVALKLYDLSLDRGLLLVRQGKGNKDRYVPIGERAHRMAREVHPRGPSATRHRAGRYDRVPHGPGRAVQPRSSELDGEGTDRRGEAGQDRLLPSVPPHDGHADARERSGHPLHPGRCSATRSIGDDANLYPGRHPSPAANPCRDPSSSDARTGEKPSPKAIKSRRRGPLPDTRMPRPKKIDE